MKIDGSAIAMTSTHSKSSYRAVSQTTILSAHDDKKDKKSSNPSVSIVNRTKLRALQDEKNANTNKTKGSKLTTDYTIDELTKHIMKKLMELLEALRTGKFKQLSLDDLSGSDTQSSSLPVSQSQAQTWDRTTAYSSTYFEAEQTTFSTQGIVQTSDGRQISFQMNLGMSRSFMEETNWIKQDTVQIMTDPLVINMDTPSATLSDQNFFFDLDMDGEKEEISMLNQGSGFLALDKNGNGIIDDGSELFGAKTGNGFGELASYDSDGNMWIDENDEIFSHLKVWTKDASGADKLLSLAEANVGAIYLGNVSTQFSLNNDANETNGQIQRTGVFLKETGEVGTVQHVDFAI